MSKTRAIVVIVPDQALNRSLAFALEADGYRVSSFASLASASKALPDSLCIIADENVFPKSSAALPDLSGMEARTLVLSEHASAPRRDALAVLTKPLSGADVLAAVARFLPPDAAYV
ncbi:hypothetical protein [Rhizobium sp. C4]|uniref:hypothetical protein n=1 Tax=Rhizobium sp. C4 TaxID=1349800 RepID=UPI001E529B3B|nr:hypothetical protein [Rhizobium sp. C4]MCD2173463.1 hypothetical protein [Rhizobium sp. C4]